MKKQTYIHPTIQILITTPENFVCLSIPIGQGSGPGGGGQAKSVTFFDEEDNFSDSWEEKED